MKRVQDSIVNDMFFIPQPEQSEPGSADFAFSLSNLVSKILKECDFDRYEISAQMSRLTGKDISKNMIDAWSSPGRVDHNLPFYLVPVFEEVCSTHALTNWLANKRGGRVAYGKETLNAEIGKLERIREETNRKIRSLKKVMGVFEDE